MARRAKTEQESEGEGGSGDGLMQLVKELWQAAVTLRGSIEPADYKRYVLPIIFLRFLSLRYERRRAELERLIADPIPTAASALGALVCSVAGSWALGRRYGGRCQPSNAGPRAAGRYGRRRNAASRGVDPHEGGDAHAGIRVDSAARRASGRAS